MANYGTKPAYFPIEAMQGFDVNLPLSIQDFGGALYDDFSSWQFTMKILSDATTGDLLVFENTPTTNGSYISQLLDLSGNVLPDFFELHISASDLALLPISAGLMPDRFYFQLIASGPAFGDWPLAIGQIVVSKQI